MKNNLFLSIFIVFLFSSCAINRIRNNVRVGKWISIDTLNFDVYKNIEYYKKGNPTKKWRNYKNTILIKSENYKGNTSTIKFYNKKKQVTTIGKSMLDNTDQLSHWYYDGEWKEYDDNKKLIKIKYYYKGILMSEREIK